jgi:hypothetical protein
MALAEPQMRLLLTQQLERLGHADIDLDASDVERVELVRSTGRAIGRERGWKIQTLITEYGSIARVSVVVREADELHTQLWRSRGEKLLRRAVRAL